MATYRTEALVLKKTKLKEKDVIVTLLASDGHQIRAVAKGGRRPGSKLTASVELFCVSEMLLSSGRTLDTVCEAQVQSANDGCRKDLEHSAAASVVCELLEKLTRDNGIEERLYPLSLTALSAIATTNKERLPLLVAASVLKIASQVGLKPALDECAGCGGQLAAEGRWFFAISDGGVLCEHCAELGKSRTWPMQAEMLRWLKLLIYARYSELLALDIPSLPVQHPLLELALEWLNVHLGLRSSAAELFLQLYPSAILQDLPQASH